MRSLRFTIGAMLATAAVVPLLIYGAMSVYEVRDGTRRTVIDGNLNVARLAGEQVRRYVSTNIQIFQALAADLEGTNLTLDQQDVILKNFVLRFPEFRELTAFDEQGRQTASSRVGKAATRPPPAQTPVLMGVQMTPVSVDADLLPTTVVSLPLGRPGRPVGRLVGEFSLEELWRMVDRIRIGKQGAALIVGAGGELLAHGNPDQLPGVARGDNLSEHPVVARLRASGGAQPVVEDITPSGGRRTLVVGISVPQLGWQVLVEQPYAEAFALARRQERELIAAISLALLIMVLVGAFWARTLTRPIDALTTATQALSEGRMDERVRIPPGGEFGRLGGAFNNMADRLVELQDNVRRQERHAMFGRIAAGLVHDLSHPFRNVRNNCRLIVKMYEDPEYRGVFARTVDREFSTIMRVFEDLRNIAKPAPLTKVPLDLTRLVGDVAESMRAGAEAASLSFDLDFAGGDLYVEGDLFALGRVCRNLITNAIEATPPAGRVTVSTAAADGRGRVQVADTGCGIPPDRLDQLFDDFTTTKRQGLGLGLAISRRIVDQLGGTLTVASVVGKGTTFGIEFPLVAKPQPEEHGPEDADHT